MTLRPATDHDAAAVALIWQRGWSDGHASHVPEALAAIRTRESFAERAAARVADTTVAEVAGQVAGFTMVVGDEVEQIYVDRAHRGSGIAEVLLEDARRAIAQAGHPMAWLAVATGNARARRFYERCGLIDEGPFDYDAATESGTTRVPCHRYVVRTR